MNGICNILCRSCNSKRMTCIVFTLNVLLSLSLSNLHIDPFEITTTSTAASLPSPNPNDNFTINNFSHFILVFMSIEMHDIRI